jgi:hypothetical protein
MKAVSKLFIVFVVLGLIAVPVFAGFINGGFESGDLSGWTLNSGTWSPSGVVTINNSYQGDTAVISNPSATDANAL